MNGILYVAGWIAWFGSLAAVILIDRARRQARAAETDTPDFADTSVAPYLALGFICGGLVLPIYFYSTRKNASGVFVGLAWTAACVIVTALTLTVLVVVLRVGAAVAG